MVDIDDVSLWLKDRLQTHYVSEVRIFGSVLHAHQVCNDIDVFVKYQDGYTASIPELRRKTEEGFLDRFGVPLHLLFLTDSECRETEEFLQTCLCGNSRVL